MEHILEQAAAQVLSAAGITAFVLFLMVCYLAVDRELDRRQAAKEADERSDSQEKMAEALSGLSNTISRIEGILLGLNNGRRG